MFLSRTPVYSVLIMSPNTSRLNLSMVLISNHEFASNDHVRSFHALLEEQWRSTGERTNSQSTWRKSNASRSQIIKIASHYAHGCSGACTDSACIFPVTFFRDRNVPIITGIMSKVSSPYESKQCTSDLSEFRFTNISGRVGHPSLRSYY